MSSKRGATTTITKAGIDLSLGLLGRLASKSNVVHALVDPSDPAATTTSHEGDSSRARYHSQMAIGRSNGAVLLSTGRVCQRAE